MLGLALRLATDGLVLGLVLCIEGFGRRLAAGESDGLPVGLLVEREELVGPPVGLLVERLVGLRVAIALGAALGAGVGFAQRIPRVSGPGHCVVFGMQWPPPKNPTKQRLPSQHEPRVCGWSPKSHDVKKVWPHPPL